MKCVWNNIFPVLSDEIPTRRGGQGAVLLGARTRVRFPATAAAILIEAESENTRVFEISAYVKDPLRGQN